MLCSGDSEFCYIPGVFVLAGNLLGKTKPANSVMWAMVAVQLILFSNSPYVPDSETWTVFTNLTCCFLIWLSQI